jgi:hypothetical protein
MRACLQYLLHDLQISMIFAAKFIIVLNLDQL